MAAEATPLNIWAPAPCDTVEDLQAAMIALQAVDSSLLLAAPAAPTLPEYNENATLAACLQQVQHCIQQMQYNHTGEKWFTLRKDRGISGVLSMVRRGQFAQRQREHMHPPLCRGGTSWRKRFPYSV